MKAGERNMKTTVLVLALPSFMACAPVSESQVTGPGGAGGEAGGDPVPTGGSSAAGGSSGAAGTPTTGGGGQGGSMSGSGAAGEGGGGEGGGSLATCPSDLGGPVMSLLRTPSGVPYCMDTTEVTQQHYKAFLDAVVPITEQPHALCDQTVNPSFAPREEPQSDTVMTQCRPGTYDPYNKGTYPIVCVEFCDAIAYCSWAGKRVCGVMGRAGETFGDWRDEDSDFFLLKNDPGHDQWFNACSGGGIREYPYGDVVEAGRCSVAGDAPVDQNPECAASGTDPPILGILGGVWEFQDLCSAGASGSTCYNTPDVGRHDPACSAVTSNGFPDPSQGFRCCYEFD